MMVTHLLTILLSILFWPWHDAAPTGAREEIYADLYRSAGSLYVYKSPRQEKHTPVPRGYEPFSLQLYARNGSRYLLWESDYERPRKILQQAAGAGKLTPLGQEVLAEVDSLAAMARGHYGQMTAAGISQHRGIAYRMFHRYKAIFKHATTISVLSAPSLHCQQSMQSECSQLLGLNPRLQFATDITSNSWFSGLMSAKTTRPPSVNAYRLMGSLFNDTLYIHRYIAPDSLFQQLFLLAANVQSLNCQLDLFRIFTRDECYAYWQDDNYNIFRQYATSSLFGNDCHATRELLSRIETFAESGLQRATPSALLSFGDEESLLRLSELLNLNDCSPHASTPEDVAAHWRNYQLFPLGANLQIVFYRSSKHPRILVKVLLNEHEARIPIPSATAPYYDWQAVKLFIHQKFFHRTSDNAHPQTSSSHPVRG